MDGASVVDYLIGDPNSLCIFVSNNSIDNKQLDLDHYPIFFFKIGNSIG
jgi:hypothetical protein